MTWLIIVYLNNVSKIYAGGVHAVRGITLNVADREFVVLVGPSGCGKSTTLRMVAGLEEISEGTIAVGGRVVNQVPPKGPQNIAHGVPELRSSYPHTERVQEPGLWAQAPRLPPPRDRPARPVGRPDPGVVPAPGAPAQGAVRRRAAARGGGAVHHQPNLGGIFIR